MKIVQPAKGMGPVEGVSPGSSSLTPLPGTNENEEFNRREDLRLCVHTVATLAEGGVKKGKGLDSALVLPLYRCLNN